MFRWIARLILFLILCIDVEAQQGNDWPYWKPYVLANIGTNGTSTSNFVETIILLNPSSTGYVQKISGHIFGISFPTNSPDGSNSWAWIRANSNAVLAGGSSMSALWIARGQTQLVAGAGENLIARDTGLWHLAPDGNVTPNISETYPDFNWTTNSLGEITPR